MIKAIDISGGISTIQYMDGTVETYPVDGYAAMQNIRQRDPAWNVPAASGSAAHRDALVAEIRRMAREQD